MDGKSNCILDRVKPRLLALVLISADTAALLSAVVASLLLRFDDLAWHEIYTEYLRPHLGSLPLVVLIYLLVFSAFRLYRYAWRFASLETVWAVVCSNTVGLAGLIVVQALADGATFPHSVLVILWTTSIILTGGVRICLRVLSITGQHGMLSMQVVRKDVAPKRAVILGGGSNGARVLRAVHEDPNLHYSVMGFLDDDPNKNGCYINNAKVLGPLSLLKRLVADRAVDEVIVALPHSGGAKLREHVLECRKRKMPVKVVPQVRDVLTNNASVQLVDFSVEDLLRRASADTSVADVGSYITGKRVLVTGAGGSIGSELCRQIALLEPAVLVLLGHGENSIHNISLELQHEYPHLWDRVHSVIASVSHEPRVNQVFKRHRPQVVFHAAAHKHVPIMETNECEAVHNNVLGTHYVSEACGRYGVERIVLISTDKAADPCCIMGATKRLCEEVVRAEAGFWPQTCYVTVRFGNVLGSRGSVVPLFREQIRRGGPVTVTHPDMTRYFMTIPEAVRLVLQAGLVGESGKLYLLDMGEPVRILDLARDMIRLSGLEPGRDIEITYTGMRPGEKLHEQLSSPDESIEKTPWKGLSLVRRPPCQPPDEMLHMLSRLDHATNHATAAELREIIEELVPGAGSFPLMASDADVQSVEV